MTPRDWIYFTLGFTICFGFSIAALSVAIVALTTTHTQ